MYGRFSQSLLLLHLLTLNDIHAFLFHLCYLLLVLKSSIGREWVTCSYGIGKYIFPHLPFFGCNSSFSQPHSSLSQRFSNQHGQNLCRACMKYWKPVENAAVQGSCHSREKVKHHNCLPCFSHKNFFSLSLFYFHCKKQLLSFNCVCFCVPV